MFDYASEIDPNLSAQALLEQQQTKLNFGQYAPEEVMPLPAGNYKAFNAKAMQHVLAPNYKKHSHIVNKFGINLPSFEPYIKESVI